MAGTEKLRFSDDHEWVRTDGNTAYIGISDFAQHSLGDIVFVDMPGVGGRVQAGEEFGSVESVKAVSDLLCPVSGVVTKINESLNDEPELINTEPYESWIIAVELENITELDELMDESEYESYCESEA